MPKRLANKSRINHLYYRCLDILEKDVYHIANLNITTKLEPGPARDLRDYIKVLSEIKKINEENLTRLKDQREAKAKKMSDDELTNKVLSTK